MALGFAMLIARAFSNNKSLGIVAPIVFGFAIGLVVWIYADTSYRITDTDLLVRSGPLRVSVPLARAGVNLVGVDRSAPMLERARKRILKSSSPQILKSLDLVRGDIRALPFNPGAFPMVLAPYGILQSLIRPKDLTATLASVARVVAPGGTFGIDLVPDVPKWREYENRVQLRGRARGAQLTLVESVRQDPTRHRTTFEQTYIERRGGKTREHRFDLTFRTLSVRQMTGQLERAGFRVDAVLGDYRGRPWDDRADVWIIMAKKR